MQDQTKLTVNGQEVQYADLNNISQAASLADDLVLGELLRVAPYDGSNVSRLILPHEPTGTVTNGGSTVVGHVVVNPFRAVVGARSSTLSLKFTDVRSAVYYNTTGSLTDATITIAAQSAGAGTKRIDLVYATLYVDQAGATATRYVKDATTHNVAATTLSPTIKSYVTVSVVAGTAGATPTLPVLPADPVGGYNIPLAYIRVDNGFTSSSIVPSTYIYEVMPVLAPAARPANQLATAGSQFFDGIVKSKFYMPPSMGRDRAERWFMIDTSGGQITDGTVIDNSIDWRKRVIRGDYQIAAGGADASWVVSGPSSLPSTQTPNKFLSNTFDDGATDFTFLTLTGGLLGGGTSISLVVDVDGVLYVSIVGSPSVTVFFWLDATGQFANPV